ncbi:proton-conducting transporter membrane subunit [Roseibium salinum]|nr:proton-conducting transporter membrane subunit [Roseibium salinum]
MLTLSILIPLLASLVLALTPGLGERAARWTAVTASAVPLVLLVFVWMRFDTSEGAPVFQSVAEVGWIPTLNVAWRVGVDGMSLAIALMSALLFLAAIAWPAEVLGRARLYYGWFLFLESVSLGLFLTLDLLVFYVFFDLSLVGMYFLICRWGHGQAQRAALKFFIYTLAGSLAILLAILGLVLASDPITFDMRELIARRPLGGADLRASLVLAGFLVGFAIKTPLVPFHTWLPPAHVDAPGPASAILAGVLLKNGNLRHGARALVNDAGRVRALCAADRDHSRHFDPLGCAGRLRTAEPEAPDRLHLRQSHGLHGARHCRGRGARREWL